ncbi:hypothetical protein CROQUDRAFT_689681 [Cronartium quercuum f. sp. fusiforme G11]|uniref:Tc1-like transposase DDE domain-containing protein n=1 Tax=Cronartium quercuum f. sp. fusiforme G11 TaxID=708437 RepID=A0A9P6NAK0_9BASI|nr:hypothetical protein CROQUDRAFT_689681 [Cronartium quercuum f. sp. fusiforme G11]
MQYLLLPAISLGGVIALDVLEGSVNQKRFMSFLKHMVLLQMNGYPAPNSILVLDNTAIHHGAEISCLCADHGEQSQKLFSFSQDLNQAD